jgi:hypothetical protein
LNSLTIARSASKAFHTYYLSICSYRIAFAPFLLVGRAGTNSPAWSECFASCTPFVSVECQFPMSLSILGLAMEGAALQPLTFLFWHFNTCMHPQLSVSEAYTLLPLEIKQFHIWNCNVIEWINLVISFSVHNSWSFCPCLLTNITFFAVISVGSLLFFCYIILSN